MNNNDGYVDFEDFYKIYPRKTNKKAAYKIWNKLKVTPSLFLKMKLHFEKAYINYDKQFIPHPSTYLNGERWEDEIVSLSKNMSVPDQSSFLKEDYNE